MAYMNFAELQADRIEMPRDIAARRSATSGFTALEWQVVAIAQNDRMSSLNKPGRLSVALGMVFGGERPNPRLADTRLEALRRLSVLAWHRGYSLPHDEVQAFYQAGYSDEQFETLLGSISRGRAALNMGNRYEYGNTH